MTAEQENLQISDISVQDHILILLAEMFLKIWGTSFKKRMYRLKLPDEGKKFCSEKIKIEILSYVLSVGRKG